MNRRIPRISLFVVLLLSMLVVFQMGSGGTPARLTLAQEGGSCELIPSFEDAQAIVQQAEGTPVSNESVQIISSIDARSVGPQDIELATNSTSLELFGGTDLSFVTDSSSIIFVEQGTVTLTVCQNSPPVAVQHSDPSSPMVVMDTSAGPATDTLEAGSTIYLSPGAVYYLQASDDAVLTTMSIHLMYMLCNGGGC